MPREFKTFLASQTRFFLGALTKKGHTILFARESKEKAVPLLNIYTKIVMVNKMAVTRTTTPQAGNPPLLLNQQRPNTVGGTGRVGSMRKGASPVAGGGKWGQKEDKQGEKKAMLKLMIRLVERTHFNRDEIEVLTKIFQGLVQQQKGAQMEKGIFRNLLHASFFISDEIVSERLFKSIDNTGSASITMVEFMDFCSVYLLGTSEERAKFAFNVYDLNKDGFIDRGEIFELLRHALDMMHIDDEADEGIKDLVDICQRKLDVDHDGRVSYDDFRRAVVHDALCLQLLGPIFPEPRVRIAFVQTISKRFKDVDNSSW